MARPSKATDVLSDENRSHRTKAEMAQRQAAEKSLLTGRTLHERPEVKNNAVAHIEFLRVNALFELIGKNDALYEPVINRYCMLQAECSDFERKREAFACNLDDLIGDRDMDSDRKYRLEAQMQKSILDVDKQIQNKRKMMFDIEKENCMSISAAMRSIPKAPDAKENPLLEALRDGDD